MAEDTSPCGGGVGGPEDGLYVPGVDYVSPWRDAAEVADEVNAALVALGIDVRLVRAVPHVGAHGEPVLWLRLESARVVARAIRRAAASPAAGVVAFQRVADDRDGELRDGAA